jgi:hypothetical protein
MKARLLPALLLLSFAPLVATGQTVADRLRELDRLRAEGLISESVHNEQWNKVIADALKTPGPAASQAQSSVAIPKLNRPPEPPKFELILSGSWMSLDAGDADVESTLVTASFGYFATERLQVVFALDYLNADLDGLDLSSTGLGLGADYHFGQPGQGNAFIPYAGAGVAWMNVDLEGFGDDDDWAWEVRAGLKQYVGDRAVIKYQAGYRSYDELDLEGFSVTVGIGIRF